ncbi:cobalamin B12-binding domain-containing protein [Tepidanaerobacter syntrophicus]|uniref:cobalamin B12-binding domain-containing protein n=1 Tax=Tepidanaerobacter syntrophicus TaxID=224999 RepID=UPI001BD512AF|nr:cobalamin-dependent protein [Tepidanaerobacter syntrophicus]
MAELREALKDLNEDEVYRLVDEKIKQGVSPLDILDECNKGLMDVGELFAAGNYFLTELLFSAEIMQNIMQKLEPLFSQGDNIREDAGIVVIGTVKGDIHDIGKNIVVSLLRSHGFKVIDLGVDVPVEKFIEALKETDAKVLGLSALLNSTYPVMKDVVEAVKNAGLRDKVKIIIGGTICSEAVREFTGADAYANDALTGVNFAKKVYANK